MPQKINPRFDTLLGFTLLAGLVRLLNDFSATPLRNFSPVGAMALLGRMYLLLRPKAYRL